MAIGDGERIEKFFKNRSGFQSDFRGFDSRYAL